MPSTHTHTHYHLHTHTHTPHTQPTIHTHTHTHWMHMLPSLFTCVVRWTRSPLTCLIVYKTESEYHTVKFILLVSQVYNRWTCSNYVITFKLYPIVVCELVVFCTFGCVCITVRTTNVWITDFSIQPYPAYLSTITDTYVVCGCIHC